MERFRILMALLVGAAMLLVACDGQNGESPDSVEPAAGSTSTVPALPSTPSTIESTESTNDVVPDYATLIATVEGAMQGTAYAGAALEDVEVFVATAELFCDLLDEGMTIDEVLADYLDRLSDDGATEVDEDDGLMAGVLLGTAVEVVCPDHSEAIP